MLSSKGKQELLLDILNNPDFTSSITYINLLKYLVESTINDKKIKEFSIAVEVFGKDADFNPAEDSSVRVYVSNLRKKLDNYYNKSGKDAKYRIKIPKGHYEVEFIKAPVLNLNNIYPQHIHKINYTGLILIIIFLFFNYNPDSQSGDFIEDESKNSWLWSDILNSDLPTEIVIGDDIFFIEDPKTLDPSLEYPYSMQSIVRKHFINNEQDFLNFKLQYSSTENIIKNITTYKFLPFHSIYPFPKIARLFDSSKKFTIQYSSALHAVDMITKNIIFMGSFRNLYALEQVVNDKRISFKIKFVNSYLQIDTEDSIKTFTVSGTPDSIHTDYCLVRKIPGPSNNSIFLFITFHESAIASAVDYLFDANSLKELEMLFNDKLGYLPKYYDIVFESSGFERMAYKTSIVFLDEIIPSSISIW